MDKPVSETQSVPGQGVSFEEVDELRQEVETLRARLVGLSEATLLINEDLDLGVVLQGVIDAARSLTAARYGALLILDSHGGIGDLITSGITPEEIERIKAVPQGLGLLAFLNEVEGPLRLRDIASHPNSVGFPKGHPPMRSFLGIPMRRQGERLGNIYLTEKEGGREFTPEDEEILAVFASHAATAITNARRYRSEMQARADLAALVDTSPVGVLVFDAKTRDLLYLNEETRRIVRGVRPPGRTQQEIHTVMSLRHPDGQEMTLEQTPLARAIRNGETVRAQEMIMLLPDGDEVPTVVNATPVFSEEGEVVTCITTMQDMTPLQRLERLRTEFIGMVSHELRTPLAAIKGSAATVLSAPSSFDQTEMRHFFLVIDEQADRMRVLISDLLDTAQIEAGTLSVATEPTDLAELVEEAKRAFLRGGGATNLIEADLPPGLPQVYADRQRLGQVLNNLFVHASRQSAHGSAIRVSVSADDFHVSISVTDEGRGLSAEELPHIFRKFPLTDREGGYRLSSGESLGLVISKGVVEAHGGSIWAESGGPGLGTRFTFTVPAVEQAGRLPANPESTAGMRERILLADDDQSILLHLRNTLREAGYHPIAAGNLQEAEHLIRTENPHLVLLNPSLAEGGVEVMDGIREFVGAPVIFMSEQASDEDVARAFDMGADDYILKPFSPTELVARIRAVLRRQSEPERPRVHEPYMAGDLVIDYSGRRVTVAGQPVQLTPTEYGLLFELSTNAGRVLSQHQLLRRVWGPGYEGDSQPLRTYVKNLRRKLGDNPKNPSYIFTEPRIGYRMAEVGGGARVGNGPNRSGLNLGARRGIRHPSRNAAGGPSLPA